MDWEQLCTEYKTYFNFSSDWGQELQKEQQNVISFLEQNGYLKRFSPINLFTSEDTTSVDEEMKTAIEDSNITLVELSLFSISFVESVTEALPKTKMGAEELYEENIEEKGEFPLTKQEFIKLCTIPSFFNPEDVSVLKLSKDQFVFEEKPEIGEKWKVTVQETKTPYIVEVVGFEDRNGPESELYDPYCLAKLISIEGYEDIPESPVLHLDAADFNNGERVKN